MILYVRVGLVRRNPQYVYGSISHTQRITSSLWTTKITEDNDFRHSSQTLNYLEWSMRVEVILGRTMIDYILL